MIPPTTETETLVTCPDCGLVNTTAKSLAAHRKRAHPESWKASPVGTRRPLTLATLDALPPVAGSEDEVMGRQLTEQWERVKASRREDLIFGAMMLKVRERCGGVSACGHSSKTEGTGLAGWLDKHAPTVSRGVAYRLMEIAEGVRDGFALGKIDLEALLTAQVEGMEPRLAKKREAIEEVIEGRSQRQLLLEFGRAERKPLGGDTTPKDGTTRPRAGKGDQAQGAFHGLQELLFRCISPGAIALMPHLPAVTDEPHKVTSLTHLLEFTGTLRTALQDALKIVKGRA